MHDDLGRAAFYRFYFEEELALSDLPDDLPLREYSVRRREILDRIFGPDDAVLRQRLQPRLTPPDVFDDDDRAAARKLLSDPTDPLDHGVGLQVLQSVAARRRMPPSVVIGLGLPGGYTWRVEFDPAPAIHHSLSHPTFSEPLVLGYRDPHFKLPILRWSEVEALVRHLAPRERVLLLSTAWRASDEDPAPVLELITRVLREADVLGAGGVAELAQRLNEPIDVRWRRDENLGWVNDGRHSIRNPENEDLEPAGFAKVRSFLHAAGVD
jgi:hypothetical protein